MSSYWFASHSRRGSAASVTGIAEDGRAVATITLTAEVSEPDGTPRSAELTRTVTVYGPGDLIGLDSSQVLRMTPVAGDANAEPNYLPSIEFAHPDLPWMFSPVPVVQERLHPWIALVVVEEAGRPRVGSVPGSPSPVLIASGAELPEVAEASAWAHLQVLADSPVAVAAAIAHPSPATVRSRLLSARRLRPNAQYVACVVPTFESGRRAGLAQGSGGGSELAWSRESTAVMLPVYHHWRFRTGDAGDFESLARRLKPASAEVMAVVGKRSVLVDGAASRLVPAGQDPGFAPVVIDLATAITTPDTDDPVPTPGVLSPQSVDPDPARATTIPRLTEVLDRGERQRQTGSDKPVVGPPIYGQWPAQVRTVEAVPGQPAPPPWLPELNLDPEARACAGAGVAVVQREQEDLMAGAWDQLASVVEANRRQRWGQLFMHAAESMHIRRVVPRDGGGVLQAAGAAAKRVRLDERTVASAVDQTAMPSAVVSSTFARTARRAALRGPSSDVASSAVISAVAEPLLAGRIAAGRTRFDAPAQRLGLDEVASLFETAGMSGVIATATGAPLEALVAKVATLPEVLQEADTRLIENPPMIVRRPDRPDNVSALEPGSPLDVVIESTLLDSRVTKPAGVAESASIAALADNNRGLLASLPAAQTRSLPGTISLGDVVSPERVPRPGVPQRPANPQVAVSMSPGSFGLGVARPFGVVAAQGAVRSGLSSGQTLGQAVATAQRFAHSPGPVGAGQPAFDAGTAASSPTNPDGTSQELPPVSIAVLTELAQLPATQLAPGDRIDLSQAAFDAVAARVDAAPVQGFDRDHLEAAVRIDSNPLGTVMLKKLVQADAIGGERFETAARWSALVGEARSALHGRAPSPPSAVVAMPPAQAAAVMATVDRLATIAVPPAQLRAPEVKSLQVDAVAGAIVAGVDAASQYSRMLSWMLRVTSPTPRRRSPVNPIMVSPKFRSPFVERLQKVDRNWVLGNADALPPDSIALLSDNRRFVEAALAGANHEFARELLWRRYPTDQMGTCFDRFWPTVAKPGSNGVPPNDIASMEQWGDRLGNNPVEALIEATTIVVIRGELLRRYPETIVGAVFGQSVDAQPDPTFEPDPAVPQAKELFRGFLPSDITYVALDISPRKLVQTDGEKGWYISLAQPPEQPRFGADVDEVGTAGQVDMTDISDLSWGRFEDAGLIDPVTEHIRINGGFTAPRPAELSTWGPGVASGIVAAALVQLPFRLLLKAVDYLPKADDE